MFNDSKIDPKILAKASEWTEHRVSTKSLDILKHINKVFC